MVLWLMLLFAAADAQSLIVINQPWVRPAGAGQSTEAYMNLTSTEGATLVSARSDGAADVTLHPPGSGHRKTDRIALPAQTIVELAPGKYRFTLRGLTRNVRLGDIVPLTLTIQGADGAHQEIAVGAVARLRSPVDDERRAHAHHH
jgi:hypothetical protein